MGRNKSIHKRNGKKKFLGKKTKKTKRNLKKKYRKKTRRKMYGGKEDKKKISFNDSADILRMAIIKSQE